MLRCRHRVDKKDLIPQYGHDLRGELNRTGDLLVL